MEKSATAALAKALEEIAWILEDLAIELDENATVLEWEKQWTKRDKPFCGFDSDTQRYKIR